jgi:hypothetical protein
VEVVLHEIDPFAGDGVGDDHDRLILDRLREVAGVDDLREVVAVDLDHMPAEGLPLLAQVFERHDLLRRPADLNVVPIGDGDEVRQPVLGGKHRRLPRVPLVLLAVAHRAVNPAIADSIHLPRLGNAGRLRQPRAERPAGRFQPGKARPFRMALQTRPELAERHQLLDGEVAGPRHRRVAHRDDVPIGEDQPVALRPVRILRVVFEDDEVERREDVGHPERPGRMPAARLDQHLDDVLPDRVSQLLQLAGRHR